ncbi:SnoaL-like domain-containing protein [Aquimarina sp. W85]|uniref:SnoaL-like domain-containing protein n=1 Tax=Aquimarina rhodophyticola TaxID=3342246 RepID=UPI00366F6537
MNTHQIAHRLVELCRKGENMQAIKELYANDIISREMPGVPNEITKGKEAVTKKSEDWYANVEEYHGGEISDPLIAENYFSCKMSFDCTFKDQGRTQMEELGVFKVHDGAIIEEQFYYEMPATT